MSEITNYLLREQQDETCKLISENIILRDLLRTICAKYISPEFYSSAMTEIEDSMMKVKK